MGNELMKNIIGSGVTFPIVLSLNSWGETTWAPVVGDVKLIEDNIRSLLLHNLGQKLRCEDFGTRLNDCIEEPNNQVLSFLVKRFIVEGILQWEPRVELLQKDVIISQNNELMRIEVYPTIIDTQNTLSIDFNYNTKTGNLYVNN